MFGAICAGRPVQTNLQILSPTQFAFHLPAAPSFNHLVIFLLPGNTLPPDSAAAVYIQGPIPAPSATAGISPALAGPAAPPFRLLGALTQDRQSAIYRVRDGTPFGGAAPEQLQQQAQEADEDLMIDDPSAPAPVDFTASAPSPSFSSTNASIITLGISIEPAASVAAQLDALHAQRGPAPAPAASAGPVSTSTELVRVGAAPPRQQPSTKVLAQRIIQNAYNFLASFAGGQGGEMVPLKSFQEWWDKFERRVELDPGFLERAEDG